jgi:hypothetical protein
MSVTSYLLHNYIEEDSRGLERTLHMKVLFAQQFSIHCAIRFRVICHSKIESAVAYIPVTHEK